MSKWMIIWLVLLYLYLCLCCDGAIIHASNGVVATDHGQCSTIGRDVLKEGGHAVDAAVAAALCLGVISPASSGIGGGAFMLVRSSDGKAEAYDMRETAPKLASKDMYTGNSDLQARGALSIGVPGELAGLVKAWKKYGTLPWKRLVEPAAQIAKNGFKISPFLHMQMTETKSFILADKGLRNIFTSNGSLLQIDDVCYNKELGRTLTLISRYGPKVFYNGTIGIQMVQDVQKAGGILEMKDLQQYKVKIREPTIVDVMGLKILSMPPPSSGGAAMSLIPPLYFECTDQTYNILIHFTMSYQILNIMSQYQNSSNSLMIHREVEALKHAFALTMNLGDPDFVNVTDVLKDMLSKDFASEMRKTILDKMTFNSSYYGGRWNQIHDHGTSHISIVDKQRNAVSMTNTINAYFGSTFLSPSTGILLNNEMDDFSIPLIKSENISPPAPANFIYPGKRPLSSMTPTIILKNEQVKAVVGASGGSRIIAGTMEVVLNHLMKGMDPLASVLAPRVYHQLVPNVLEFENWTVPTGEHFEIPEDIRADLEKKGHVLRSPTSGTICQFVVQDLDTANFGGLTAVSDPRKGGYPSGF